MNLKTLLLLLIGLTTQAYSQSSCPNSDFESGTLDGWQGRTGNCCPIYTSTTGSLPSGIIEGRHTIMTGTGTDPNTCDNVTVVAPGGLYSARVGNEQTGSEAETLSYTITVTPSSSLFIYKYAVVLQDPGHDADDQPRFQVRVLDADGNLIDPSCGEYTVVAGAGLTGFQTCNINSESIRYRDWTTVGLNLSAYMGQTISIEFETGDCKPGAHFGYAYVDAYCLPLSLEAAFCTNSAAAELTAPIGFSYLWSTGETTQTILITNPTTNASYSCTLTSVTGCTVVLATTLQVEDPIADFILTNTCFNNAVFEDTTVLMNPSLLDAYLWDFGDGTTSDLQNPVHTFPAPGNYTVTFTAFNAFGCSTTATKSITVYSAPSADLVYEAQGFCTSDATVKAPILTGNANYTGGIYSVDVSGLSINLATGEFNPGTSTPGTYVVTYTIPTRNGCTVPTAETAVYIYPAPQAFINYNAATYCNFINSPQSPNLTGMGTFGGGNYTAVPSGLSIDSVTGQVNPSQSHAGVYTVTYHVPPNTGVCDSVDGVTTVTILASPTAILRYASPYCNSLTSPQAVTLTTTGVFGPGSFSSYPAGLFLNTATGAITPSLSTPGNYTVEYFNSGTGGCSSITVSVNVAITILPTAAISYGGPFCRSVTASQPVTLTGTEAFTGGVFTAPNGVSVNSSTGDITPSASIAGTHQVVYTILASLGCTPAPVITNVTILPLPEPVLYNLAICEDPNGHIFRPALLDTGLSDLLYTCQWFFNGAPIPGVTVNRYTASVEGNYSVLVTNLTTGCVAPAALSTVSTAVVVEDFQTYITNTFSDNNTLTVLVSGGTGPYLFRIDDEPFQASNVFTQLLPGVHTVTVTDVNNCTDVTKRVTVLGFPNFFTPNGDGKNDFWNIYYFDAQPNAKIYVYDRFGKLLTELTPQSPGWDGTYNGKLMPSTDYWFLVEFKDYDENGEMVWQAFKSHFSMLR